MSSFSAFFSSTDSASEPAQKPQSSYRPNQRKKFLVGGGMIIAGLVGIMTTLWLTQLPQDNRQQASELSKITLSAEIRSDALAKGLTVNDSEVNQITEKINRIKNSKQAVKLSSAGTPDQSATQTALTWEAGLTSIALEKIRNPQYSPLSNLEPKFSKFSEVVKSGVIPNLPANSTTKNKTSLLGEISLGSQLSSNAVLPANYDWRTAHGGNFLTGIRDQGQCGSCWSFSGNATLETALGAYFNQPTKKVDLSEQNLLSCSTNTTGCSGTISLSKDYHDYARDQGVVTESCMPYRACDQSISSCACPAGAKCTGTPAVYKGTYASTPVVWANLSSQIVDAYGTAQNIKRAIIEHGAIDTGLVIYNDFELYVNGIYQRSSTSTFSGGHAISIIGWGEENGQAYWLIKNSWSNLWGIQGYGKYKMFGATPGSTIDLNAVYANYKNVGGPDFGIEGMAGLYAYLEEPLLLYIDTPTTQGDNVARACTDRDQDSYCFWGFGAAKPATGCPTSCASHSQPDCDDGRNTLGVNCEIIDVEVTSTPTPSPTAPIATITPTRIPTVTPGGPTTTPSVPTATPTQIVPTPINIEDFCSSNLRGGTTKLAIGQCSDSSWAYQFNFPTSTSERTACKTTRIEYCGKGASGPSYGFTAPVAGEVVVYYKAPANVTAQLKSGSITKTLKTATNGKWKTGLIATAGQTLDLTVNMGDPPMLGWTSPVGNNCKGFSDALTGLNVASLNTQTSADGVIIAAKQCWGDGSSFEAGGPNAGKVSLARSTVGKTVAIKCTGTTEDCRQAYFEDMDFNDGAFWVAIIPSSPSPTPTATPRPPSPTPTGSRACNSVCTTRSQCRAVNPAWDCVVVNQTNQTKRCRLAANPTSNTCTPVNEPSPTPTPPATLLAADINQDGIVNQADLTILLNNYGQSPLINPRADVNRDGVVNAIDYVYVLDYYGQGLPN